MNRLPALAYLALLCILVPGGNSKADSITEETFYSSLAYFEDRENKFTIQEISSPSFSENFIPAHSKLNFGNTSSVVWFRFLLDDQTNSSALLLEIDNPTIEYASLFTPEGNGEYTERISGARLPFQNRELASRNLTFPLELSAHKEGYFYLSVKSEFPLQVPLAIYKIQDYKEKETNILFLFFIYLSIVTFTIILCLFYFFLLKDVLYLYYCGFAMTMIMGISMISGIAYRYIWPDAPDFNLYSSAILVFLSVFFMHGFARKLMCSRKYAPLADKIAFYIQVAALTLLIIPVFRLMSVKTSNNISIFVNIASILSMVTLGSIVWKKGYKPATFYFIGFAGLAAGVLVFILGLLNIIENKAGFFSIGIGSLWEMTFLIAGMAVRYKLSLQQEQESMEKMKEYKEKISMLETQALINQASPGPIDLPRHLQQLSERELEVLCLIAKGLTDKEIAEKLFISITTVKSHARNIYAKLLVSNRTEAVSIANAYRIIPL